MEKLSLEKWLNLEQKILNAKINGRKFVELTVYRGVALWWFIRFRLYHSARTNPLINSLIKNTFFFSFTDFLYNFFTCILCRVLSRYSEIEVGEKRQPKVLITGQNRQWGNVRTLSGRLRKSDAFFDSVITELKRRNYKVVTVYPLDYSVSGVKVMIDKLRMQKEITHKAFNRYWSIKIWKKTYDARRYFRNIWKNVLENDEFIGLLKKYGLKPGLSFYFNSFLERIVKIIEMARRVVEEEKPDLILISDEYGIFGRALVVAGKLKGVPTLAIQHGNIGPLHVGYIFSKDSISAYGSVEAPYCPIPDKTAVYGPYYYDLLTKMSVYPSSTVVITGQPRYDILAVANRVFSRERFCARLGLDPGRKIVLVATQPWSRPMREAFIRKVLAALKHFPEAQIIIKPHPREKGELYKKVIEKENVKAIILPSKSETFETLYTCDLLVAGFSTVITEALVLGKPAITISLRGEEPTPYYKRVTLRVHKEENLAPAIRKALYDKKTKEKLKKERKKFVSKYAHKQNGKATERVVSLIERMKRDDEMKIVGSLRFGT